MLRNPHGLFIKFDDRLETNITMATELNIASAQLLAPPQSQRTPRIARELGNRFQHAGIALTALFCGFNDENHTSIEQANKTVGLAPADTFDARMQECRYIVEFTAQLQIPAMALHPGRIPEKTDTETYARLVNAVQELCDECAAKEIYLLLQTGQETAKILLNFIHQVNRANLGVNFDPANMILFGSGDPVSALRLLGHYVKSVHIRDAAWSDRPGMDWGTEVLPGAGNVRMEHLIRTLLELDYQAPLTIKQELAGNAKAEIQSTLALLKSIQAMYL